MIKDNLTDEELALINGGKDRGGVTWSQVDTIVESGLKAWIAMEPVSGVTAQVFYDTMKWSTTQDAGDYSGRHLVTDPMSGQVVGHGGGDQRENAGRHNGSDNYSPPQSSNPQATHPMANGWDLRGGGGDSNQRQQEERRFT